MTKLIDLLYIIARAIQGVAERAEQKRRQKERDELESDPAGWFDGHFGGMRNQSAEADKADAERNAKG